MMCGSHENGEICLTVNVFFLYVVVFFKAGGCRGAAGADSVSLCRPGHLLLPGQAPPAPRRPMSGSRVRLRANSLWHQTCFGNEWDGFDVLIVVVKITACVSPAKNCCWR